MANQTQLSRQRALDVAKKVAYGKEVLHYDVKVISAATNVQEKELVQLLKDAGFSVVSYSVPGLEVYANESMNRTAQAVRRASAFSRIRRTE